ncbi:MAG: hypothetical protein UY65_C0007G0002 [Parcubacteria group bacterium GW2011_GWA2_51_12]|nr:MAG: hypothetical protein UY65_C0007G0002 [Parcubacteria group bacterium GW2011_GWA2_51_12]
MMLDIDKNKNIRSKLKKSCGVLLLAVLVIGAFALVPVHTAQAACSPIGGYCITLTSTDPTQPVFGSSFTANSRLTVANPDLANSTVTFAVRWKANPSGLTDFTSNLAGETSVTVNVDASGNGSADLSQAFSSGGSTSGFTLAGPNTVGVKFEVVSGGFSGGPQAFETIPVSFQAPPVSGTARVEINHSVTSAVSGLEVAFEAVYWPAGATSPIRDGDLTVNWLFGDGGTATLDYQPNHTYATPGTKTVSVTVLDGSGNILASGTVTFDLAGNPTTPAGAGALGGAAGAFGAALLGIVNLILGFVVGFLRWVLNILAHMIFIPLLVKTMTLEATNIAGPTILAGWTVVRDLVNMFFILILIVIGFATILHIESYNYKRLLVKLIIMAMLVNFSMVIARIIIDLANVVQFTFLPVANGGAAINDFWKKIYAQNITAIISAVSWGSTSSQLAATMSILFQFTLELGLVITFAAMSIFMLIRTVALWILIILSPFAYALNILPATAGYAKQWWSAFIKYVLFAPIMAFFLRLSISIYEQGLNFARGGTGGVTQVLQNFGSTTGNFKFQDSMELGLVYIMIICFLWAGLIITKKMGIFGADAVVGFAERGMKAGLGAATYIPRRGARAGAEAVGRYAATKYDEKTLSLASGGRMKKMAFAALHPFQFAKAMKTDSVRDREKAQHLVEAGALKVKRATPFIRREGRDPMYHAMMDQGEVEINEQYGKYTGNESEEIRRTEDLEGRARNGDKKAARMLAAQLLRNAKGKHDNEWIARKGLGYTQANMTAQLNELEHSGAFSESFNEELQTAMSQIGYEISNPVLTELSDGRKPLKTELYTNPTTGKKEYRYEGVQELTAAAEHARRNTTNQRDYEVLYQQNVANLKLTDEDKIVNGERALKNIANRNNNVSKVDKFNMFHNAMFTTKVNTTTGQEEASLGEGGDQAILTLQSGDIWRASRNGFSDKQKEWMNRMIKENNTDQLVDKIGKDYSKWLASRGEYKNSADFDSDVKQKVEMFAKAAYASKFAKAEDHIKTDLRTAGVTPGDIRAETDFMLDKVRQ